MTNYYYLAASLPPLDFPSMPDVSSTSLTSTLKLNLSKSDLEKVTLLRRLIDLYNIRPLLLEEEIDFKGNLSEKELDEALLIKDVLPEYVFDFLDKYDSLSAKLKNFAELIACFFQEELSHVDGFLKEYITFERNWRLVILGIRSKVAQRDVTKELMFEDMTDPMVAQILAQKDAEQYEPPSDYKELKERYLAAGKDPFLQQKMLLEYRFNKVAEFAEGDLFGIDSILAYLAQLMIIESWNELDQRRGLAILDTFKSS